MQYRQSFSNAAIVIALSTLSALSVSAQAPSTTPAPATSPPTATSPDTTATTSTVGVNDTKLEQFADAYVKIQTLKKDADAKQTTSADPAAAQKQQAELQSKMAEAVQTSGLDVNEFNQIAQAMVSDTDLRAKVLAKVQQRTPSGG